MSIRKTSRCVQVFMLIVSLISRSQDEVWTLVAVLRVFHPCFLQPGLGRRRRRRVSLRRHLQLEEVGAPGDGLPLLSQRVRFEKRNVPRLDFCPLSLLKPHMKTVFRSVYGPGDCTTKLFWSFFCSTQLRPSPLITFVKSLS